MEVRCGEENDRIRWSRYIAGQQINHHAFCWEWREIIHRAFKHPPQYLLACSADGNVCGVLPLFEVRSMLFGAALVSLPYLNGGGVLADSPEIAEALITRARELARSHGTQYLELRHRREQMFPDLQHRAHKISMVLPLAADPEEVFSSFRPKLRSQIRRPTKSGIIARVDACDTPYTQPLSAFFEVFSQHMRDLGTPVFPKRLFSETQKAFGKQCRIITVWHEQRPVAAGITVGFQESAEMLWAASLRQYARMAPNMLLYWEAIKTAALDGYRYFDFGRSSYDSGPHRFKQQWGAEALPLHWYYDVVSGEIPDINPNNPRFSVLVRCWQHLPVGIANVIGPWITRSLP